MDPSARVLHYTRLERPAASKHSSLLDPFRKLRRKQSVVNTDLILSNLVLSVECSTWRRATQHNDIQNNDTQHKGLISDNQHNNALPLCSVSHFIYDYVECRNAGYAE
jgi:hypothetical protein